MGASDAIALSAVVIALLSLGWSFSNGRTMARIDRREHEWQAKDRRTAHIEVTRHLRAYNAPPSPPGGPPRPQVEQFVRLRNAGQVPALEVEFRFEVPNRDGAQDIVANSHQLQTPIPEIHPGEWIDLHLTLSMAEPLFGSVSVSWLDDRYAYAATPQRKTSVINL